MDSSLDRSSSEPLWAQLEIRLRRGVDSGEFDDHFPTDLELTRLYEVSRHTVREAVRQLQSDGIIRRERGRGTVVEQPRYEQRLGTLYSLFTSIEAEGVVQRSEVVDIGIVTDGDVAERLRLPADAELFRLERIRLADDEPLAIDRAWLPAELARPLLGADFTRTALYDELDRRCGCRPNHGWERITPVVASFEERRRLGLDIGQAIFRVERVGQCDDVAIEWRETLIRGDRYRFVADWTIAGSAGLRLTTEESNA